MAEKKRILRGQIDLPAGGIPSSAKQVVVLVEDVSRADAPSLVVGEQRRKGMRLKAGGSLPFAVEVPESLIEEGHSYSLRVHIDVSGSGEVEVGDLISTQTYPVLTRGHGSEARVKVKRI